MKQNLVKLNLYGVFCNMTSDDKEPMDPIYAQLASKLQSSLSTEKGSKIPIISFLAPEIKLEDSGVIVNYLKKGAEQQKYGVCIRFNYNNCNFLFSTYPLNRFEVVYGQKSRHMSRDEFEMFKKRVLMELTDEQKIELNPILKRLDDSFELSFQRDTIARINEIYEHYNPNRRRNVDRKEYIRYENIYTKLKEMVKSQNTEMGFNDEQQSL